MIVTSRHPTSWARTAWTSYSETSGIDDPNSATIGPIFSCESPWATLRLFWSPDRGYARSSPHCSVCRELSGTIEAG
jgi:hypothetical protein